MLPILPNSSIREVEAATMENAQITALDLMERAGSECAQRILALFEKEPQDHRSSFLVLAGMGNNGGDGLVIARKLIEAGRSVRVVRVLHRSEPSAEHVENWQKLVDMGADLDQFDTSEQTIEISEKEIVIDSIFGTGLTRPPEGLSRAIIEQINRSQRRVIAIDLPSGMVEPGASGMFIPDACIQASLTLTFEVPRLALLLPETGTKAGKWELVPIGLLPDALEQTKRDGSIAQKADIQALLRPRPRFGHKGTFGHALLVAGSSGMVGASVLAARACLRSGCGLVTAHIPASATATFQAQLPEVLTSIDPDELRATVWPEKIPATAIGIGPGIGKSDETATVVRRCLETASIPKVLDADALNLLAMHPAWQRQLITDTVLTPHPKEMDRILGLQPRTSFERLQRTRDLAQQHRCHIVLKGAYTAICDPQGEVVFNSSGNQGMAKGGSGDVLTGLLTGLLAQGYPTGDACLIATYLHGSAGDIAAARFGMDAMLPTDLIDALPDAWKDLRGD